MFEKIGPKFSFQGLIGYKNISCSFFKIQNLHAIQHDRVRSLRSAIYKGIGWLLLCFTYISKFWFSWS